MFYGDILLSCEVKNLFKVDWNEEEADLEAEAEEAILRLLEDEWVIQVYLKFKWMGQLIPAKLLQRTIRWLVWEKVTQAEDSCSKENERSFVRWSGGRGRSSIEGKEMWKEKKWIEENMWNGIKYVLSFELYRICLRIFLLWALQVIIKEFVFFYITVSENFSS